MRTDFQQAYQLRLKGKSYGEISKALSVPKSTLSSWFKDLKLPIKAQKLLEAKGRTTRESLMKFNRRRTKAIQVENQKIRQETLKEIHSFSKYELLLIGTALYWAEGQKRGTNSMVKFVNSDPAMIALYLRFLREIIQVPEQRIYPSVRIHPNIEEHSTIGFWSKVTRIPRERFKITRQISRASNGKRPRYSLPNGTLELCVSKRQKFFQIKGWIDGLKNQSGFKL